MYLKNKIKNEFCFTDRAFILELNFQKMEERPNNE